MQSNWSIFSKDCRGGCSTSAGSMCMAPAWTIFGYPLSTDDQGRCWHGPADFRTAAIPSGIGGSTDGSGTCPRGPYLTDTVEKRALCTDEVVVGKNPVPASAHLEIRRRVDQARLRNPLLRREGSPPAETLFRQYRPGAEVRRVVGKPLHTRHA